MAYDDYTPPDDIRPGTRKHALRAAYKDGGEDAMRRLNALFKEPIQDDTRATWLRGWRHADHELLLR